MISVTALGEVLIDFTDAGVSEGGQKLFERNAGGAPANVLVALQRMGFETAFIGKIGNDMHGEFLRGTLTSNGVNCDGLITDPDFFTTLAFVALDEQGDRSFSFARKPGADTQLRPEEIDERIIRNSRIFHIGSLSLTDEPARSATHHALELAKEAGCVLSYDPNYRANLWPNVGAAMEQMRSVLHRRAGRLRLRRDRRRRRRLRAHRRGWRDCPALPRRRRGHDRRRRLLLGRLPVRLPRV